MTPERVKYYSGINKEETFVRNMLNERKCAMRVAKTLASLAEKEANKQELETRINLIKNIKIEVTMLKRQLPAPLKHHLDYSICRCGMHYERPEVAGMFYCKRCGQAIRPASW